MNFEYLEEEIQIYDRNSCLGDDEESIIHLWQSKSDNVVFTIKEGYELFKQDDGYGRNIYIVKRKNDRYNKTTKPSTS